MTAHHAHHAAHPRRRTADTTRPGRGRRLAVDALGVAAVVACYLLLATRGDVLRWLL